MTRINLLKICNIKDISSINSSFIKGIANFIMFENNLSKEDIINNIYDVAISDNFGNPYVIKDFYLRPYLNIIDNIFDIFGIDIYEDVEYAIKLKRFSKIFEFNKIKEDFYFISDFDKLKASVIVSLFSSNNVVVFDMNYSLDEDLIREILDKIVNFKLFSEKIFIIINKTNRI